MSKSLSARIFVALIVLSGVLVLGDAILNAKSMSMVRFVAFVAVASLAARLKVKLPGVTGTMSVNLPFILVAAAEMSPVEALTVGCISTLFQCLPRDRRKFSPVRAAFNCSVIMLAVTATQVIFSSAWIASVVGSPSLRLATGAIGYILVNTIAVAVALTLTEGVNVVRAWTDMFQLSFPYLVASAGVAGLVLTVTHEVGWQAPVVIFPVMMGVFNSYRRYFAPSNGTEAVSMNVAVAETAAAAHS